VRASVRDPQTFESLRPLEVVSYLRATGWTQQQVRPERYSVWTRGNGHGDYEIVVPLTRFRDFALRMSEVLATLESAEERSQLQILADLSFSNADVVRISSDLADTADGTIPIEDAVTLVQKARDAVLAAACSAIEPRAYFAPRKFDQALDYVKKVKMGQTERGSYTVIVVSKVALALQQRELLIGDIEEPYERRVVRTLGTGVTRIRAAAELAAASGSLDSFKDGVNFGISANLCNAVVGMIGDRELVRGLEFSFSWSRTRPQRQDDPAHIFISPDSLPVIEEAGRLLREISPREEFELEGIVVKLDRQPADQIGQVTVLGFIEGRPHNIRVELGTEDYDQAVLSHAERRPIFALGDLVKEGRSYVLRQPRGVRLINPEQDIMPPN
jgi:hypothetical protein